MRWLRWLRAPFLFRLCIVNLVSDPETALRGVIWQTRGPWLVLRQVALLKGSTPPTPVDGEVVVHRDNVAFVQLVP